MPRMPGSSRSSPVPARFVSIEALAAFRGHAADRAARHQPLCGRELLRRYHGGAGLRRASRNVATRPPDPFHDESAGSRSWRRGTFPTAPSLFINIGTTTEEVAVALLEHSHLRVITTTCTSPAS